MPSITRGDTVEFKYMVDGGIVLTKPKEDGMCLVWWPQYGVCEEQAKQLTWVAAPCIEEMLLCEDEHVRRLGALLANGRVPSKKS